MTVYEMYESAYGTCGESLQLPFPNLCPFRPGLSILVRVRRPGHSVAGRGYSEVVRGRSVEDASPELIKALGRQCAEGGKKGFGGIWTLFSIQSISFVSNVPS